MKASELKVGDQIRIIDVPEDADKRTKKVWEALYKRGRSVRISEIDDTKIPWYWCRFKEKNGKWYHHHLSVTDEDANWILVKKKGKS